MDEPSEGEQTNKHFGDHNKGLQPLLNMKSDKTPNEYEVNFDDALAEASTGRAPHKPWKDTLNELLILLLEFGTFNGFLIFVTGLVIAYQPIETFTIGFVVPMAQCDFSLSSADKGLLNAMVFTGILSSAHLWGFLADKIGRHKILTIALFTASATSALSSFSPNFVLLLITRYLTGFFISGTCPTIFVYLGEFHTTNAQSRVIMAASFIYSVLFMVLPLLAWLVINQTWTLHIPFLDVTYKPWRLFILVGCLPGLFCGFCILKLPESPKFLLAAGRQAEAMKVVKTIYSSNTEKSKDTYKVQAIKEDDDDIAMRLKTQGSSILNSAWTQTLALFSRNYIRSTLLVSLIQFGVMLTASGMYVWFRDILNQVVLHVENNPNSTISMCGIVYSSVRNASAEENEMNCVAQLETGTYTYSLLFETIATMGFVVIGFIINAVGKKTILIYLFLVTGPCGISAAFINHPMAAIYLYEIFLLSLLGITVVHSITVQLFPTKIRAMAIGVSFIFGQIGSIVGTNLIGVLIDTQCESTFVTTGAFLIICAFLSYLIPLKENNKDGILKTG